MKKNYFTREEQIILSAIELIDKLGIDGLSIRELAKKENVTEGALYRHFKSKNEIIIEVIRYYARFDINIINTINENKSDAKYAILFLINSFAEYYENYPEITAVLCSFESLIYEPVIEKEILQLLNKRADFLIETIENGKKSGEFNSNVNSEDLADIIMGSFREIVFKWRIEKYAFSLKKKAVDITNFIIRSAMKSM